MPAYNFNNTDKVMFNGTAVDKVYRGSTFLWASTGLPSAPEDWTYDEPVSFILSTPTASIVRLRTPQLSQVVADAKVFYRPAGGGDYDWTEMYGTVSGWTPGAGFWTADSDPATATSTPSLNDTVDIAVVFQNSSGQWSSWLINANHKWLI